MLAPGWVASPDQAAQQLGWVAPTALDRRSPPRWPGTGPMAGSECAPSAWTVRWDPGARWTGSGGLRAAHRAGARPGRAAQPARLPKPAAGALAVLAGCRSWRAAPGIPPDGCRPSCACPARRCFYWVFYHQVQTLWPVLRSTPLDGTLVALEARLWGLQPALAFQAALPQRWLSELFCFAYFAYYLFVPVVGLTALLTRGYRTAERILLATTGCFFGCYTCSGCCPRWARTSGFRPGLGPRALPRLPVQSPAVLLHRGRRDPGRRLPLLAHRRGAAADPAGPARRPPCFRPWRWSPP